MLCLALCLAFAFPAAADLPKIEKQYKRVHQAAFKQILSGNIQQTIADLKKVLDEAYVRDCAAPGVGRRELVGSINSDFPSIVMKNIV